MPPAPRSTHRPRPPPIDVSHHYLVRRVFQDAVDDAEDQSPPSTLSYEPAIDATNPKAASQQLNKRIASARSLLQLHELHAAHGKQLDTIHAVALLVRLAHIEAESSRTPGLPLHCAALFKALVAAVDSRRDTLDARGCASVLWALGKLKAAAPAAAVAPLAAWLADAKLTRGGLAAANATDVACAAWGLARLDHPAGDAVWQRLVAAASSRVDRFQPSELAMVLWALARTHGGCSSGSQGDGNASSSSSSSASASSGGEAASRARAAFAAAAAEQLARAPWRRPAHDCADCATLLWALAKLRCYHQGAFVAASRFAVAHLRSHTAQGISTIAWACATAGHYDPLLLRALLRAARWKARKFSAQGLSNLMWACATFGHYDHSLHCAVAREVSWLCALALVFTCASLVAGD